MTNHIHFINHVWVELLTPKFANEEIGLNLKASWVPYPRYAQVLIFMCWLLHILLYKLTNYGILQANENSDTLYGNAKFDSGSKFDSRTFGRPKHNSQSIPGKLFRTFFFAHLVRIAGSLQLDPAECARNLNLLSHAMSCLEAAKLRMCEKLVQLCAER